jgi:acetolactate synthase-1/2/3 large subunit
LKMILSGAEIIWECLQREGVEVVFGYPGGAILPAYDALRKYPSIHHVLTRHEQGATHMADGYARATGKVGVAVATSGPGATNLVTGIGTAMMDSSPMVCITGQVPMPAVGTDGFQEADVAGVTMPITKHNYLVTEVEDLAYILREAFHIARSGRPGPVLVDIPKDIQVQETEFHWSDDPIQLPGFREADEIPAEGVQQALRLIREAQRPVILAGHGVLLSGAEAELLVFAERADIPVALTLLGKGAIAEDHQLCLGMMRHSGVRPSDRLRHALRRSGDRQYRDLRPTCQQDSHRHRRCRDRQERAG